MREEAALGGNEYADPPVAPPVNIQCNLRELGSRLGPHYSMLIDGRPTGPADH
jgi:hypothetical protein